MITKHSYHIPTPSSTNSYWTYSILSHQSSSPNFMSSYNNNNLQSLICVLHYTHGCRSQPGTTSLKKMTLPPRASSKYQYLLM